jgi:hypothetical protein
MQTGEYFKRAEVPVRRRAKRNHRRPKLDPFSCRRGYSAESAGVLEDWTERRATQGRGRVQFGRLTRSPSFTSALMFRSSSAKSRLKPSQSFTQTKLLGTFGLPLPLYRET